MAFRDVLFPGQISSGADSTPSFQVNIARTAAGNEYRTAQRGQALHRFTVPLNTRSLDTIHTLKRHFMAVNGPLYCFPFNDTLDFKSCQPEAANTPAASDSLLGNGDGSTATFQCRKNYTYTYTHFRTIYLPVSGTLLVQVNGVLKTETTHYTVNYETGVITFTGGNIPPNGHPVRAGFQFNCKVRYASNDLQMVIEAYATGSAQLTLIEVPD